MLMMINNTVNCISFQEEGVGAPIAQKLVGTLTTVDLGEVSLIL